VGHLIVVSFGGQDEAGRALESLRSLQKAGQLRLDDTVVVVKDADGKVRVDDTIDRGVITGAVGGGVLGLLVGFMFPVVGLAVGVAGGALVGKLADTGVDKKFIDEVTASLTPGSSELFAVVAGDRPEAAIAAFEPFAGTLRHTSLPSDIEDSLRRALQ
jgi:uncharacterized membrane protein